MRAPHSSAAQPTQCQQIDACPARHPRGSLKGSNVLQLGLLPLLTCLLFQVNAVAQFKETRRVLILNELGSDVGVIDREIFTALGKAPYHIQFYIEDLDTNLFPEKDSQSQFSDWYLRKYRDRTPDLIIAVGPSPVKMMAESHQAFAPNTPIVFWGSTEEFAQAPRLDSDFTGVWGVAQPDKTLDAALHLQPGTKHVVVVGGVAPYDRHLETIVKERFRKYESKLEFTYLTDLAMPELIERLKHLPSNTIVYHTSMMQDAAGTHFVDAIQAVPMETSAANAPVYVVDDVDVGRGTVGGDVTSFVLAGRLAAGMALRILNGEKPQDIPIVRGTDIYLFDWRALRRWGLKESDLPPDSVVLEREPTFWEAYRRHIIVGIFVLFAQTLAITALLWQRAKRRRIEAQLIRYSDQLRMAMESGKSVGWEWDLTTGRHTWFGDLRTMFGIPYVTFTGKVGDFFRYVHPEDRKRVSDVVAAARQEGKTYMAEYRILWPDGTIRWIVERGKFDDATSGVPARMVGMAVDITDRKQAEEALKSSEENFSKAFRESLLAKTLTSIQDHRYLEVNETFERLTGWRRDEILGRTPLEIESWVDPTQRAELVQRLLIKGTVRDLEVKIRRKDGQIRTTLGTFELIEIRGEPCALSMIADVTDLRRAEQAEQAAEDRFKQFFETLPEYCFITSADGEILDINPAACSALGYSKEELIGKPLSANYVPGALTRLIELSGKWKNIGTLHNEEIEILTKQGQKRTVLVNAGSLKDKQGNLLYTMTVQVDVTERKQIGEKLRESQNRLEGIIASAMDAIIAVDQEHRIVVFNTAAEKMFGLPSSDAIGSPINRFIPERFRTAHTEHIRHFGETGMTKRAPGALWALRANGDEFPIETSISQLQTGNHKLFTVIIRDVTDRHRAEEALRQSEERSRELVRRSPIAMVVTEGREQRVIMMNDRFTSLLGYTLDDVPDVAHWWPLAHPDEAYRNSIRAEWDVRVEEALKNRNEINPMEATVRCKDGSSRYIEFHFSPLRNTNIVSFVDLTERKEAETVLQESEERFRHVADTAPVMIWMAGADKLCTYFNSPWLQFTGRRFEEELGNGWTKGVNPDDLQGYWETYANAFDRQQSFQMEYRLRRYDGEYRWMLDHGLPRLNSDGSFAGYIGSCIDITDRKLAQETLTEMSRKLIEAQEQERTWIARELHDDINQQIALATVNLERLKQDSPALGPAVIQRLDEILDQVSGLGGDIQALSHRLHSSKLEYLGIVAAASSFCRELSDQHGVQIDFHSEGIPKDVHQEIALCLFRILQESLQNAIKHSGAQRIEAWLRGASNEIALSVRDAGIGFSPEEALRGRGLGLTSMRERLKLVHGKLSIDSQTGLGTIVRATVPLNLGSSCAGAKT